MSTTLVAHPTSFSGFHGGHTTMNGHSHHQRRAVSPVRSSGSSASKSVVAGTSSISTKDALTKAPHGLRHAVTGHIVSANGVKGLDRINVGEASSHSNTQTVQDKFINVISNKVGIKFHDLAALLKDPLIFVPPKFKDDEASKIPYEPLPTGPSGSSLASTDSVPQSPNRSDTVPGSTSVKEQTSTPDTSTSSSASKPNDGVLSNKAKGKRPVNHDATTEDPIPMMWPQAYPVGPGYHNLGNTCFLNSTLQALAHTAPLVACLVPDGWHSHGNCRTTSVMPKHKVCLLCCMQKHVRDCFKRPRGPAIQPSIIVARLQNIARHMRVGRQEDAHEFLRFFLDHLQEAAAANLQPVAKTPQQKEQTFLYRIFGGKLRSRVTCGSCNAASDTYDSFMDLSIDVADAHSVQDALRTFTRTDQLRGANRYKCEKCKTLVNATKQFSVIHAPQILHIHLKRFTPTGRKIVGHIAYNEQLSLAGYMSPDCPDNPNYRLYAVVCHSGSGPHSGHYFAHVRASNQKWYCMNDSSVSESSSQAAASQRNAYLLFYERIGEAAGKIRIPPTAAAPRTAASPPVGNINLGKRKDREEQQSQRHPASHQHNNQPFPPRPIKVHFSGANHPKNSASSPFHTHVFPKGPSSSSSSSPHNFKAHTSPIKANGFYGGDKHRNKPKIIHAMQGRPRP